MAEQYMTMAEIEAKYPNQWVLIDKPKTSRTQQVLGGYLVMHSANREEFDRRLVEGNEFPHVVDCAILFTGVEPVEESALAIETVGEAK